MTNENSNEVELAAQAPLSPGTPVRVKPYTRRSAKGNLVVVHEATRGAKGGNRTVIPSGSGVLKPTPQIVNSQTVAQATRQAAATIRQATALVKAQKSLNAAKAAASPKPISPIAAQTAALRAQAASIRQATALARAQQSKAKAQAAQQKQQKNQASSTKAAQAKSPAAASQTKSKGQGLRNVAAGAQIFRAFHGIAPHGGGFRGVRGFGAHRAIAGLLARRNSSTRSRMKDSSLSFKSSPDSPQQAAKEFASARRALEAAEIYRHSGQRGKHAFAGFSVESLNTDVEQLQEALKDYGFPVKVTGVFDDITLYSLDAFLSSEGLSSSDI